MKIEVYSFEDKEGLDQGFTTQDPEEAKEHAQKYSLKWIANIFEFADSELVEDYTSQEL